jgi:maltooligosyltrehalose trehalohydrolase
MLQQGKSEQEAGSQVTTIEQERTDQGRFTRRLPVGAEAQAAGGVHFRVWAPNCRRVAVQTARSAADSLAPLELSPEEDGYYAGFAGDAGASDRYWFLLDDDEHQYPDPASRFQPEGPHGPSEVVDPAVFAWRDQNWQGIKLAGQVIYEMHLGTFTLEGTWRSAERELPELAAAGITLLEVMPVATFPGRFNWGYDGVGLYAPCAVYGQPDDMRRFVDAAHSLGIGVILDVVYNHFGPDGNYTGRYSRHYLAEEKNDWGQNINFDGPHSGPVREFFIRNAGYWIDEFHLDGLRLDATQDIHDRSSSHVLCELTEHARDKAAGRQIVVIAENEPQDTKLIRPCAVGGHGLDGAWNDDFHHAAVVALTRHNEAYLRDYKGTAQEFVSACKYGFLYQGQWYAWQEKPRGSSTRGIAPWAFVTFLENHDQVSNTLRGVRLRNKTSPGRHRALTALLLLGPNTPMLFQGQEFGASTPFLFFADHQPELAEQVYAGRREFLSQFPSIATEAAQAIIAPPADERTFTRCKLKLEERQLHAETYQMHKDLLRLRREEPALQPRDHRWYDGAVLGTSDFVLRYFGDRDEDDRLLMVCLGRDCPLTPAPEPLLAPPSGCQWTIAWSSEDPRYGGSGTPPLVTDESWRLLGESAIWLRPERGFEGGQGA